MRIIGGRLKGRRFPAKLPQGVRPTTDSARETIFNILLNYLDFKELKVCDVFAGSGAFGFESISRGAASCVFIDKNKKAVDFIRAFTAEAGIEPQKIIIEQRDALKFFSKPRQEGTAGGFDLIFMDPPYHSTLINSIISGILDNNYLSENGMLVLEMSSGEGFLPASRLEMLTERTIGQTRIIFLRFKPQ
jgi:16S rRNA (guanine966-N2)-methyltransferase